jgi:hypothetical protein
MGRTETEVRQASGHVKYEIDMLRATMSYLSKSAGQGDKVEWDVHLESFALHVRNLIDFFYTPPKDDDIVAEYYVSDVGRWNAERPAVTSSLLDAKRNANKRIAHLTFGRLVADPGWAWETIRAELQPVMECFLSHLPAERGAWFAGSGLEEPSGPTGVSSPPEARGWTGPPGPHDPEKAKTSE